MREGFKCIVEMFYSVKLNQASAVIVVFIKSFP